MTEMIASFEDDEFRIQLIRGEWHVLMNLQYDFAANNFKKINPQNPGVNLYFQPCKSALWIRQLTDSEGYPANIARISSPEALAMLHAVLGREVDRY